MANAQVEKLKALGLRHGEKAVVALAGLLCLLFLVSAATKKTIDLTPEQVSSAAKQADSRLRAVQKDEDILALLEEQGIKNASFEKLVDAQEKDALNVASFKAARPWVLPEPGAGLIRDTPELVAPTELYAFPGRGGALVFELDENGQRIPDKGEKVPDENTKARRKSKRRRGGMMGSMMGGMMPGMMPGMGNTPPPDSPEAKKAAERKQKELDRQLAGNAGADDKAKEKETGKESETVSDGKEIVKGLRWVSITGVLDHEKIKANYLAALKNPAVANPNYKQLDVQRQVRQSDGTWSDWEDVDSEKNRLITYNLPEEEEELTPDEVRINTLVDPLPFLKAGLWERVHVARLVPKEKREVQQPTGGMMGGMGGEGMMMPSSAMMGGKMGGAGMMMGSMDEGMMMGGMMGGGAMGGGEENTSFQKTEEKTVMIRSLDFTVERDTTYRFRLRVVVYNPNYGRKDVSAGTDVKSKELKGPWSEPTGEVTMPADVATYVVDKAPSGPGSKRTDQVTFQVVRWSPEDGVTVTRTFTAGPGEIVGEPATTQIPNSDGEKPKSRLVDYNSRHLVLDTVGGPKAVAQVGASGGALDVPALSLLMRPDGAVVVRNEAFDLPDPVRKDMDETYKREISESGKARKNSQGMMGPMGGMMMGPMGGKRGAGH